MNSNLSILYEDDGLVAINKPAGLVCHPTKGDAYSSLISRVRLHLGEGTPAHLINRLDRETSGVVLVAKRDETARELRKLWENREVRKEYLAIVHGHPAWETHLADLPLGKDEGSEVAIKDTVRLDGAASQTELRVIRCFVREGRPFALVEAVPRTGRKHQIRIHLAHLGHAIVGDKLYGPDENLYLKFVRGELTDADRSRLLTNNHALHAASVVFEHLGGERVFTARPEPEFQEFLADE